MEWWRRQRWLDYYIDISCISAAAYMEAKSKIRLLRDLFAIQLDIAFNDFFFKCEWFGECVNNILIVNMCAIHT